MAREVFVNEATASRRRVYFHLVDVTDGMSPELGEGGGQPEVSLDGAAWAGVGTISTLVSMGLGRYYADLSIAATSVVGTVIESRYKSVNTAECPGDTIIIVGTPVGGAGAIMFTYTVTDSVSGDPIPDVQVWVSTDVGGSAVVAGALPTDAFGNVVFYLDAGTYYFWRHKFGWTGANPDTEVVS